MLREQVVVEVKDSHRVEDNIKQFFSRDTKVVARVELSIFPLAI